MPPSARETAAADFRERMQRSNELHQTYLDDPGQLEQYDRFTQWQMDYLLTFFKDLHERPGFGDAIDFVISDLAGVSISERDQDLQRAAPAITTTEKLSVSNTFSPASVASTLASPFKSAGMSPYISAWSATTRKSSGRDSRARCPLEAMTSSPLPKRSASTGPSRAPAAPAG